MEKQKTRLIFEAHEQTEYGYPHLRIHVRQQTWNTYREAAWYTGDEIMEMHWQGDSDKPGIWYAFGVDVDARTSERLNEAASILGRIEKYNALEGYHGVDQPLLVLDALEKMKAVEVKYDCRFSEHLELKDLLPQSFKLYGPQMWPYKGKVGHDNWIGRAVCETEAQAKTEILMYAGRCIQASNEGDDCPRFKALVLWLGADSPVEEQDIGGPEDRRTAREMVGVIPEKEVENVTEGL